MTPSIRSDELGRILHIITTRRPDLQHLDWATLAPRLDHTIALAAWRSQTPLARAQALIDTADALSLARPALQPQRHPDRPTVPALPAHGAVAHGGWTGNPVGPL